MTGEARGRGRPSARYRHHTRCGRAVFRAAVTENGYAERLTRTIKEEEVDLTEYEDFADALRQLGRFLDEVYNRKRIHSSLGYLTPSEFEQQWIDMRRAE